jgi:hypothetical protein
MPETNVYAHLLTEESCLQEFDRVKALFDECCEQDKVLNKRFSFQSCLLLGKLGLIIKQHDCVTGENTYDSVFPELREAFEAEVVDHA